MLRIIGYSETSQESFHRHANCAVSNDKLWIVKGNGLEINIYSAPDSKGVLDSTYILHPGNQCQLIHALDQPINGLSTIDKNVILKHEIFINHFNPDFSRHYWGMYIFLHNFIYPLLIIIIFLKSLQVDVFVDIIN